MPTDARQSGSSPDADELLTPAEVAAKLKVTRDYVYTLLGLPPTEGGLASIVLKGGRLRRVRGSDLETWIADQPAQPDAVA